MPDYRCWSSCTIDRPYYEQLRLVLVFGYDSNPIQLYVGSSEILLLTGNRFPMHCSGFQVSTTPLAYCKLCRSFLLQLLQLLYWYRTTVKVCVYPSTLKVLPYGTVYRYRYGSYSCISTRSSSPTSYSYSCTVPSTRT